MKIIWSKPPQEIAREYFPEAADDEEGNGFLDYVLWNCTGYPGFWEGDPETCLRQQLQAARDGKCAELKPVEEKQ